MIAPGELRLGQAGLWVPLGAFTTLLPDPPVIEDDFMVRGTSAPMRIVADEIMPDEDGETVTLTVAPLLDDIA